MNKNTIGTVILITTLSLNSAWAEDPKSIKIEDEIQNGISEIDTKRLNQNYRNTKKITHITFHHEGYAGPSRATFLLRRKNREATPTLQRAKNIHGTKSNGGHLQKFGMLAYHYIVGMDGEIVKGRPIKYKPGTHSPFDFNGHFAVVALGDFDHEVLTSKARQSYVRVMSQAQRQFQVPTKNIQPHQHFHNGNLCPGFSIVQESQRLITRVMIHSIQSELAERGCGEVGQPDGIAGPNTRRAFLRFLRINMAYFKNRGITDSALMEMLRKKQLKCS